MKRLGKFLVVLFTIAALVGVVAVVASADTTSGVATVTIGDSTNSYETLKAAYDAVNADTTDATATITLLKDYDAKSTDVFKVTRTTGPVVFDLNGKSLELTAPSNKVSYSYSYLGTEYVVDNETGLYANSGIKDKNGNAVDGTKPGTTSIAYGAISVEANDVNLTISGNGGKITQTSSAVCSPMYVSSGAVNSTLNVYDLTVDTKKSSYSDFAVIYARDGVVNVDNCYFSTGTTSSPVIRHNGDAIVNVRNSLIENYAASSSYHATLKFNDTATKATSGLYFDNCSIISGNALVYGHSYNGPAVYKELGSGTTTRVSTGYDHRVATMPDGSAGPTYVNTNMQFVNCTLEQYNYDGAEAAPTAIRSWITQTMDHLSLNFKGCDITFGWQGFSLNKTSDITMDDCVLSLTGLGDIKQKVNSVAQTGAGVKNAPYFFSCAGKATVTNTRFLYPGKELLYNKSVTVYSTIYTSESDFKAAGNSYEYTTPTGVSLATGTVDKNSVVTPLSAMATLNSGKVAPDGSVASNRTNIMNAGTLYGWMGSLLRQGDITMELKADGKDTYLCYDPSVVNNIYNQSGVEANANIYVKLSGDAYVPAQEGDEGAIYANAWVLGSIDGYAEYIDINNDGTADYVDADRSGVLYNGTTQSGSLNWETKIPEKYTKFNISSQESFFGNGNKYAIADTSYLVVDVDISSGEGSTGFLALSGLNFEGRTTTSEASGEGAIDLKADGTFGSTKLTPGEWYHVTFAIQVNENRSESVYKVFVDGKLVHTATSNVLLEKNSSGAEVISLGCIRYSLGGSLAPGAKLCIDNSMVNHYDASYSSKEAEILFSGNYDLSVWSEHYSKVSSAKNSMLAKTEATVMNVDKKKNTYQAFEGAKVPFDSYVSYIDYETAFANAKHGDVVTLYTDVEGIKINAPITVNTNGHIFTYYSDKFTATESDGKVVFSTAKPEQFTAQDIELTYTQLDGTTITENYGKLALGSYVPIDNSKINAKVGYDILNGTKITGVSINGEALATAPKINTVYKYVLSVNYTQYGWFIITKDNDVYLAGDSYKELASLVADKYSYKIPNRSTIRFFRDYGASEVETMVFRHLIYSEDAFLYVDLNGHTITDDTLHQFVLDPIKAMVFKSADGTESVYSAHEYVSYATIKSNATVIATGSTIEDGTYVGKSCSNASLYIYTSRPGGAIINTTKSTSGSLGALALSCGASSTPKLELTDSAGNKNAAPSGISCSVYLGMDGMPLLTLISGAELPGSSGFNSHLYYNNVYAEAKGSSKNLAAGYNNGGYIIAEDTTFVSTTEGYSMFHFSKTIEGASFTDCTFVSTSKTPVSLFNQFGIRMRYNDSGVFFEDCMFSNIYLASKSISYYNDTENVAKYMTTCVGPTPYLDGDITKFRICAIFNDGCVFDTEYKGEGDGFTKVDGLYWVVLDTEAYKYGTGYDYKSRSYEPQDLYNGAVLWNNDYTDPRTGLVYNMTYTTALNDNVCDVTFNCDGNSETVKYAIDGTAKYDIPGAVGKVMEKVANWDKAFAKITGNETYTATVSYKPTISVFQNLSLYSSFKYNLYIPTTVGGEDIKDYITSVTLGNNTYLPEGFETATVGGTLYYVFTVADIDSNKTAENITFTVELKEGENTATGTKTLSVLGYLETALKNTDPTDADAYRLYQATLNYTKCAYDTFGGDSASVVALWNAYCKDKLVEDAIDTTIGTGSVNGLDTAALNLVAAPAFRFTVFSSTADIFTPIVNGNVSVTYKYNGNDVTKSTKDGTLALVYDTEYDGEGYRFYFDIELRAYEFYQDITITVGDAVSTYNLANYYNGLLEESKLTAELDALLKALNTYARAAAAYKN